MDAVKQQEEAAAGTPRSREHCESIQLGGQATVAAKPSKADLDSVVNMED